MHLSSNGDVLLKKWAQQTDGKSENGFARKTTSNPQPYPQILWISARPRTQLLRQKCIE
jgi:hypothetical protein